METYITNYSYPKLKANGSYIKMAGNTFLRENVKQIRVTHDHPDINKYVVCVSKILTKERADNLCEKLNKMVMEREKNSSRFIVERYRKSKCHYVVMRQLLVDDLLPEKILEEVF